MKRTGILKSALMLIALVVLGITAYAQEGPANPEQPANPPVQPAPVVPPAPNMTFEYNSLTAIAYENRSGNELDLGLQTEILIRPYIYVTGNLTSRWSINGWGSAVDLKEEWLHIYHNKDLRLKFVGWDHPTLNGTPGAANVYMLVKLHAFGANGNSLWLGADYVQAPDANVEFPIITLGASYGHVAMAVGRQVHITQNTVAGNYYNYATMIVTQL